MKLDFANSKEIFSQDASTFSIKEEGQAGKEGGFQSQSQASGPEKAPASQEV